ncbi:MAG: GNAT family N-acetyltransferase [Oscillospiraceae bacterium]|nr:GNAT family N-acetyltransferase [Oscillospiraceae bacterium]
MIDLKVYSKDLQKNIERFFETCFNDLGWEYEPHGRHSDILNINDTYMSNGCMWCLYKDKQLIGTVAIRTIDNENKVAEMKRLYVLKEYQGKNYGDMLFKTALSYAREKKYNKICADTQNSRDASRHLMRKYGFYEIPKYNDNDFAELYFELILTPAV